MKRNLFFLSLFFLLIFLSPKRSFAAHACNKSCTGGKTISCSETTGQLTYTQGSCNSGLACYSGAGNVCRNPYCPTDTDCSCPNFTIQGYKQPNQSPFSSQTVYLDGGNPITAQPYSFSNVVANQIHQVSVSSLTGSSIGYTLCYNTSNCHTITPTTGNSVYICSNTAGTTNYADLWWHYTPLTANCSSVNGPTTVFIGDTATFTASYTNSAANLTTASMYAYTNSCLGTSLTQQSGGPGQGNYSFNWTPSTTGNYIVYCKADSSSTACVGYNACVGSPPNYSCTGPNTSLSVTVISAGPWYKLKNTSLYKIGDFENGVVMTVKKFTDGDPDDTGDRYTIIGNACVSLISGNYNPQPSYNPLPLSTVDWHNQNYSFSQTFLSSYTDYIKARKKYNEITSSTDIENNKVNLINGAQTIDNTILAKAPFVLIINGDVTINNDFNNESPINSVMIISTGKITFSSSVTYANGIFIGNQIEVGGTESDTSGLKIKGNLISTNAIVINRNRTDNSRPALFVVLDTQQFIDLLPLISTATYDFQQAQ